MPACKNLSPQSIMYFAQYIQIWYFSVLVPNHDEQLQPRWPSDRKHRFATANPTSNQAGPDPSGDAGLDPSGVDRALHGRSERLVLCIVKKGDTERGKEPRRCEANDPNEFDQMFQAVPMFQVTLCEFHETYPVFRLILVKLMCFAWEISNRNRT